MNSVNNISIIVGCIATICGVFMTVSKILGKNLLQSAEGEEANQLRMKHGELWSYLGLCFGALVCSSLAICLPLGIWAIFKWASQI